jgi:hypothetical protein
MEQYHDVHFDDNTSAATTNDVEQCLNAFDRHLESERGCAPGDRRRPAAELGAEIAMIWPHSLPINY